MCYFCTDASSIALVSMPCRIFSFCFYLVFPISWLMPLEIFFFFFFAINRTSKLSHSSFVQIFQSIFCFFFSFLFFFDFVYLLTFILGLFGFAAACAAPVNIVTSNFFLSVYTVIFFSMLAHTHHRVKAVVGDTIFSKGRVQFIFRFFDFIVVPSFFSTLAFEMGESCA